MPSGTLRRRLEALRRRWPRRRFDVCGRARGDWGAESWLSLVSVLAFIGASYVDTAVFHAPDLPQVPDPLQSIPPEQMPYSPDQLAAFEAVGRALARVWQLASLFLNAWLLDRILAHRTPPDFHARRALIWLRRLLAGVPVVGLAALPAWQWLSRRRPAWAVAAPRMDLTPLDGQRRGRGVRSGSLWRGSVARLDALLLARTASLPARVTWLLPCQIGPLLGAVGELHAWPGASHGQRVTALAAGVALHAVAGVTSWARARARVERLGLPERSAACVRTCAWAALLPFPASLLTGLPWLLRMAEPRETRSLVGATLERRARSRVPAPLRTLLLPRERPRLSPVERQRRAFYRLKTAALLWEAGALGFVLAWAGIPFGPAASRSHWALLAWLALPPLPGLLVGLARAGQGAWIWIASGGRRRGDGQPLGRFVLLAPLVAVAGLLIGGAAATPDDRGLALALALPGLCGYVGFTYALVGSLVSRRRPHPARTLLLWLGFSFALVGLAWAARQPPEGGAWVRALLTAAFAAGPVVAPLLFALHRRALLAPLRLRDVGRAGLPLRVRAQALALAAAGAAPLGGLLVPLMVAWRLWFARHYEEAWLRTQGSDALATAAANDGAPLRAARARAAA